MATTMSLVIMLEGLDVVSLNLWQGRTLSDVLGLEEWPNTIFVVICREGFLRDVGMRPKSIHPDVQTTYLE